MARAARLGLMESTECELWRRSLSGDREALGRLLVCHSPRLRAIALAAGVPPADLGDAVQEAFVRALAHSNRLKDELALASWLSSITRNVAIDWRRRRVRERDRRVELDPAAPARPSASPALELDIPGLPAGAATILRMRYVEALTGDEIAERLGIPLETAKKRLQRARLAALDALHRGRP